MINLVRQYPILVSTGLLVLSSVLVTFAWYAHLHNHWSQLSTL